MSKDTFPDILYIKRENPNSDDEFFNVADNYDKHAGVDQGEAVAVAVYRLEKVCKVVTRFELCE